MTWKVMLVLSLVMLARAVELRVASFNIGAHFTEEGHPDFSLGEPGTTDHDAVLAVLGRIDADVVALQEIASADVAGDPDDLDALATELGYPYRFVASNSGSFDTSLRVAILSRFPFLSTVSLNSPVGTKELTRRFPMVRVDVPGTERDPVVISAHLKAGSGSTDRFRRAVELRRLADHLSSSGLTASDNFIVLGDFNPSGSDRMFTEVPSGLPSSFVLGADIAFPVSYRRDVSSYFAPVIPVTFGPRQLDGTAGTHQSGGVLDLLMVSPGLAGRPHSGEIYNSAWDGSNAAGLAKSGEPLPSWTSAAASDHFAVFADLTLDQEFPALMLAASAATVAEGDPEGTVWLTVDLPEPATGPAEVVIESGEPDVAQVADGVLRVAAGERSASAALWTRRNYLRDGSRSVVFRASAEGFDSDSVSVEVRDGDGDYVFRSAGEEVIEDFEGFGGGHDPAPWVTDGGVWTGTDSGASSAPGARAYGSGEERALGFLTGGEGMVATASFRNQSGLPVTTLDLSYDVEQWRAAFGGSEDRIGVELVIGGRKRDLAGLGHAARTDFPSGAVPGGMPLTLSTTVRDLWIGHGESFGLSFTFTPGSGQVAPPDEVFVNEFHYDNAGVDSGEFVELVVGPGFTGELSEVELVLYNGSDGKVYETHDLGGFAAGVVTGSGHRLFSKPIVGLQNGSPDGFALLAGGMVVEFLSYEGSMVAVDGPAAGMRSSDIGLAEEPPGEAGGSLGLAGAGGGAGDFGWSAGAASPGEVNGGQEFRLEGLPGQGLAIDRVRVGFVADHDGDGIPDREDTDDDNDGMSDLDELAFGSDPGDADSRFRVRLEQGERWELVFHGAGGVSYVVERSGDLATWEEHSTVAGAGVPLRISLPQADGLIFWRIRAGGP